MNIYNLHQIIHSPTRITPYSSTLIDLILVSDSLHCNDRGTITPFCRDHHAVFFRTNFVTTKTNSYTRKICHYDQADFNHYRQKSRECNWAHDSEFLDDQINNIIGNVIKSAEQTIPNTEVVIRPRDLPWFHNEIRRCIRIRNRIHNLAKRINAPETWRRFREARYKVTSLIRNAKINYLKKTCHKPSQGKPDT